LDKDIELKRLHLENLELKDIIEGMKNELENIVLQIKESNLKAEFA